MNTPSRASSPASDAVPHRVSILGATGSIGDSSLRVIDQHRDRYHIAALTAQSNAEKLIALARHHQPQMVAIGNDAHYAHVKAALTPLGIHVAAGESGIAEAASLAADTTVAAIVGAAGLKPVMTAIAQGNRIALANKESLVCAGHLVMEACRKSGATLLPVDSEHNAIFQVLATEHRAQVEKITLTASGGPLLRHSAEAMATVTPAEAVRHPRWDMGAKISVDSATMMNKGLELIEAHYLFNLPSSQIDVLVHPESIIHSLVHYTDGSVLAQLGMPDMAIPIAYALSWPERIAIDAPRLDLASIATLNFEPVDDARFPAIGLARAALNTGPAHCIAFNAANEVAVQSFLDGHIPFTAIARCVATVVERAGNAPTTTLDAVLAADATARTRAKESLHAVA